MDWTDWHRAYDDPSSSLSLRLAAVVRLIRDHLDQAPPGPIRVLSLCAGDGRDLTIAARDHGRVSDLFGCLVELDPDLSARATAHVADLGADIFVRHGDAGDPNELMDVIPVDLLLLCGIFGNIGDEDIRRTVNAVPAMCRPGATVIWTRHRRQPDMTPRLRRWFDHVGCVPIAFVSSGVGGFGVGAERFGGKTEVLDGSVRLFTFLRV